MMAMGATLVVVMLLGVASVPGINRHEADRQQAQTPIFGDRVEGGLGYQEIVGLQRGRQIHRILVAPLLPDAPVPPGVRRVPRPDEVALSPALVELTESDPSFAAWFAGRRRITIAPAGLTSPDQRLAYVGVTPSTFETDSEVVVAFGRDDERHPASLAGVRLHVLGGFLLLVIVPAVVFFGAVARLSARRRRRRTILLRLLGLSRRDVAVVAAAEVTPSAVVGCVVGAVFFRDVSATVHRVPIVDRSFFPGDISLGIATMIGVVGAVLALAWAATVMASARNGEVLGVRPVLSSVTPRPVHLGVALLGISVAVTPVVLLDRPIGLAYQSGLVVFALSLPVAAAYASSRVAAIAARGSSPPSILVGLRRLQHEPTLAARTVGGLAVAVFVAGCALPVLKLLDAGTGDRYTETASPTLVVRASYLRQAPIDLEAAKSLPGVRLLLPEVAVWSDGIAAPQGQVLVASCQQLSLLAAEGLQNCPDAAQLVVDGVQRPLPNGELRSPDGSGTVLLPLPAATVAISSPGPIPIESSMVLTPEHAALRELGDDPYRVGYLGLVDATEDSVERLRGAVIGAAPTYRLDVPNEESEARSNATAWVVVGLAISGVLAVAIFIVISVDAALTRRAEARALNVIGASQLSVRGALLVELLGCAFVAIALALAGAGAASYAYASSKHLGMPSMSTFLLLAGGALAMAAVGAVMSAVIASSEVDDMNRGAV